ncbi:hypothetical protein C5C18_11850 [Rathayibacter tritici]|nr:hypothetical protein C5C18_11850 [Rathayibacter tritici]
MARRPTSLPEFRLCAARTGCSPIGGLESEPEFGRGDQDAKLVDEAECDSTGGDDAADDDQDDRCRGASASRSEFLVAGFGGGAGDACRDDLERAA